MKQGQSNKEIFKGIVAFALPYLAACLMQTLYGMADLFIIGQYCGVESTAAVSGGSQVMHMLTVVIVGLAMGTTVAIGRARGAEDKAHLSAVVGNTVTLFFFLSLALTVILLLLVRPIVAAMSTPPEAVEGEVRYLTICFLGIPFITAYNVISSIFRGMGNSKIPMYFVAVACLSNIGLDLLFIGVLGMGPAGAALGTVLAQAVSVIFSLIVLCKRDFGFALHRSELRPRGVVMNELIGTGLPIALQDGLIQIAFLAITAFANHRGLDDAAAVGIVEKLIGILFLVPSSMLAAVSALAANAIGAEDRRGARTTLWQAICLTVGFGLVSVGIMQLAADGAVGLFTESAVVAHMGGQYMRGYVWDCIFAGVHFCFSGYFCALGRSSLSFAHNGASTLFARLPLSYFCSVMFLDTLFPMGLATTVGSMFSVVLCIIFYIRLEKKQ